MDFKCMLASQRSSAKSKSFALDTKNELLLEVIYRDESYQVRVRSTEPRILASSDNVKSHVFFLTVTDTAFSPDLWWLDSNEAFLFSPGSANSIEIVAQLVSLVMPFD